MVMTSVQAVTDTYGQRPYIDRMGVDLFTPTFRWFGGFWPVSSCNRHIWSTYGGSPIHTHF